MFLSKGPVDEKTSRSLGNEPWKENLCILRVPYIHAGGEPKGYKLLFHVLTNIKNTVVKLHFLKLGLYWDFRI